MRILICGDRNYTDRRRIRAQLKTVAKDTVIIEGEAPGADTLAKEEAKKLKLEVLPFEAKWDRYGRGAGPVRNMVMLAQGKPDQVWAFHNDIYNSNGTANMCYQALNADVPVFLFFKAGVRLMQKKEIPKLAKNKKNKKGFGL